MFTLLFFNLLQLLNKINDPFTQSFSQVATNLYAGGIKIFYNLASIYTQIVKYFLGEFLMQHSRYEYKFT